MIERLNLLKYKDQLYTLQLLVDGEVMDCIGFSRIIDDKYSIVLLNYNGILYPMPCVDGAPVIALNIDSDILEIDDIGDDAKDAIVEVSDYFSKLNFTEPEDYKDFLNAYYTSLLQDFNATSYNKDLALPTSMEIDRVRTVQQVSTTRKTSDTTDPVTLNSIEPVITFNYDRTASCLQIPRNARPPINETLDFLYKILKTVGIPLDERLFTELSDKDDLRIAEIKREVKGIIGSEVDFNSNLYEDKHKMVAYFRFYYESGNIVRNLKESDPEYITKEEIDNKVQQALAPYIRKTKSGITISYTKKALETLQDDLKVKIEKQTKQIIKQRLEVCLKIIDLYVEYVEVTHRDSLRPKIYGLLRNQATPSETPLVSNLHPNVEISKKTGRLSTNTPNPQGWCKSFKLCIGGENDWEIASADITAQDVYSLTMGVLENQQIKQLMFSGLKPYEAIAQTANVEYNAKTKDAIKTPTLQLMNGGAISSIYQAVGAGNEGIAKTIINLIKNDPGYKRLEAKANAMKKVANPYLEGLFGTKGTIPDIEGLAEWQIRNKILNAPFQRTSLEILVLSLSAFFYDLYNDCCAIKGINLSNCIPILPIHDELVIKYKADVRDDAIAALKWYIFPQIEGWVRFTGSVTKGKYYVYKE